jgi:hypothetical protein
MATRPSLGSPTVVHRPAPEPEFVPQVANKPAARIGKVQLSGYIDKDAKRQLDVFAAREGRTMQSVIEEMYDLFAHRYGLHRLAQSREP